MLKDFRSFILRGNVVELSVGVLMGAAFGAVVTSLVKDVLTPLFGVFGSPDFDRLVIPVGKATIRYGLFLNALVAFLLTAFAVYFFIVRPVSRLMNRKKTETDVESQTVKCPYCLSSIPEEASVCAFCSREVAA